MAYKVKTLSSGKKVKVKIAPKGRITRVTPLNSNNKSIIRRRKYKR